MRLKTGGVHLGNVHRKNILDCVACQPLLTNNFVRAILFLLHCSVAGWYVECTTVKQGQPSMGEVGFNPCAISGSSADEILSMHIGQLYRTCYPHVMSRDGLAPVGGRTK